MRVLVVEDDPGVARAITATLESDGYVVDATRFGGDAIPMLEQGDYAVLTLDLLLPDTNGFVVSAEIRNRGFTVPVLMLTGKDGVWDEVEGLDSGADDYLTKPFEPPVLLARVRALSRRSHSSAAGVSPVGDLHLDPATKSCVRGGQRIDLTQREFALLRYLMQRAGQTVSRSEILHAVWGDEHSDPHVVHVYIGYLRRKLNAGFDHDLIRTIRGHGYSLVPQIGHQHRSLGGQAEPPPAPPE
ncbi:MAG: response regulator transcription factor [Actinomycetota bacterium]